MIRGVRGLAVLAAIAVGLALAIALGESPRTAVLERSLWPQFADSRVDALRWSQTNTDAIAVERRGDGPWVLTAPSRRAAAPRAVETVLSTLRGARWHRRAPRSRAGAIRTTLTVHTMDQESRTLGLGDPLGQGADQAWVAMDDWAYLVDGWVVRALDVELLALCNREPLGELAAAETSLRIVRDRRAVELRARPWRDARGILAPQGVETLTAALSQLRLVQIPKRRAATADRTTIELPDRGISIGVGGACPGAAELIALESRDGDGCVEAQRWNAVLAALTALDQPADQVLDRRLAAGDVVAIKLPDGTIHVDKRPTLTMNPPPHSLPGSAAHAGGADAIETPADPERVAELRAALATAAEVVAVPPGFAPPAIEVSLRSGVRIALARHGSTFVRDAEAIGLRSSAAAIIGRPIAEYIDPTRWVEDANAVAALEVTNPAPVGTNQHSNARSGSGQAIFKRGAVVGEWQRDGQRVAAATAVLIDALVQAVSQVRASATQLPPRWNPVCIVSVTFAPPVGASTTHRLELGSPGPRGCFARIDGAASFAPPELCAAALGVLGAGR